jgi:hypothetical protein
MKATWWGYKHINGSIQVKLYFGKMDLLEADESPFVRKVFQPFEAESREDAIKIIKTGKSSE